MRSTIRCLMLLLLMAGGALFGSPRTASAEPKCEPDKLAQKYPGLVGRTIKSGEDPSGGKPLVYPDPNNPNEITGLDVEYARAAFKCLGVPLQFVIGGLSGTVPAIAAGQIDIAFTHIFYTPERAKQVDIVLFTRIATGIIVRKGNPANIHSLDDLCGKRGTAQIGSTEVETLQRTNAACIAANKPAIDIAFSQNRPSGLQLVKSRPTVIPADSSACN